MLAFEQRRQHRGARLLAARRDEFTGERGVEKRASLRAVARRRRRKVALDERGDRARIGGTRPATIRGKQALFVVDKARGSPIVGVVVAVLQVVSSGAV